MISDQKTSDSTPSTLAGVAASGDPVEALAQGVERAGADVAVDDAERAQRSRARRLLLEWARWSWPGRSAGLAEDCFCYAAGFLGSRISRVGP